MSRDEYSPDGGKPAGRSIWDAASQPNDFNVSLTGFYRAIELVVGQNFVAMSFGPF